MLTTKERYQLIDDVIKEANGEVNISILCDLAEVSRSGYYSHKNKEKNKNNDPKEIQDQQDFELILEVYKRKKIKKGARTICMILNRENHKMNLKK